VRVVHTSDWHLGRAFHQVGLLGAQARFVDWLVDLVRAERVEAVLVAGDVYDRALPSPDTVALLDDALTRLVDAGAQVVLSSGNHDSAVRLGFASELLARAGVHVRTDLASIGRPVLLGSEGDELAVYPVPYLEPAVAAPVLDVAATHSAVLGAALARVQADAATRHTSIAMAHAFVAGGVGCESERDIAVGGVSVVDARLFEGVSYAALGHLHGAQQVGEQVAYCGSPVAMSFGEASHTKSVTLLDTGAGAVRAQSVPTPVERPLAVLRGELDVLLADRALSWAESAWCMVVLTDPVRPLGALETVRRRFPHTLCLDFQPSSTVVPVRRYAGRDLPSRPALDVCCDFLSHVRGGAGADEAERELLQEAVEATRLRRAAGDDEGRARAVESTEVVA